MNPSASAECPRHSAAGRRVAGVRLRRSDPVRWYDAGTLLLTVGDYVVVPDVHGTTVGQVVVAPEQIVDDVPVADLPPVLDRIDPSLLDQVPARLDLRKRVVRLANALAHARGLKVRVTRATVAADGSRVCLFYRGEDRPPEDLLAAISGQVEVWVVARADDERER